MRGTENAHVGRERKREREKRKRDGRGREEETKESKRNTEKRGDGATDNGKGYKGRV